MKRAKVVIGVNLGDEGKGLVTDYLCDQAGPDTLVVRHNGGAQAGHTVQTPRGLRHVFHHFGSGTFAGARTFLGPHFVSNPILFVREVQELMALNVGVRVLVDPRSAVTTPYDMLINQSIEDARGPARHGSCGVGFNETIVRNQHPKYALTAGMLANVDDLLATLLLIRDEWVPRRLVELGNPTGRFFSHLKGDETIDRFIRDCRVFCSLAEPASHRRTLAGFANVVFEGAQGLLLDQKHHWFPHVSRSFTGLANVVELAQAAGIDALDVIYVTRAYMTRHGAGPFPTEYTGPEPLYPGIKDQTNIDHPYQGPLRIGMLSLDLMRSVIPTDLRRARNLTVRAGLAVTCLDQVGDTVRYVVDGALRSLDPDDFLTVLEDHMDMPVRFTSRGPTRADVQAMENVR